MPRTYKKEKKPLTVWIGIDNGVTGSIGIIDSEGAYTLIRPKHYVFKAQDYQKKKQNAGRIDVHSFYQILETYSLSGNAIVHVMMERPLVNPQPKYFATSLSGIRTMEAMWIVIQQMHRLPLQFIDSKEWQSVLLPKGTKGSPQLKKASITIATRYFPLMAEEIRKQKDGDGLLIAEYCRRFYSGCLT